MTHSMHWKYNCLRMSMYQLFNVSVISLLSTGIPTKFEGKKNQIPAGEPDHILFPWGNGSTNMGIVLDKDESRDVTEVSENMDGDVLDFIPSRIKRQCVHLLSNPGRVQSKDAIEVFLFLKRNIK